MKQILRIFAKDVRQFWAEILITLALSAALVHLYPHQWWNRIGGIELPRAVSILLIMSWCLLIARVLHAEPVVGNRQFWLTRPYEWKKLLAAKLLFLAVFLAAPLVISQCLLLRAAGLHPLAAMHGMRFSLLLISGIFVAPLVAIAAVTSGLASTVTTAVAVLVGGLELASLHWRGDWPAGLSEWKFSLLPWLPWLALFLLLVCCVVLLVQYALRRVWLARSILIGTLVVLTAAGRIVIARPHDDQARIAQDIPPAAVGASAPLQLSFGPKELERSHATKFFADRVTVVGWLGLPPRAEGTVIDIDQLKVTFETSDGHRWSSVQTPPAPSLLLGENRMLADTQRMYYFLLMPVDEYNRFRSNPPTAHFSLSYTESSPDRVFRFPLPKGEVSLPGLGVCSQAKEPFAVFKCRSAFRLPTLTHADAEWSDAPCSPSESELQSGKSISWMGSFDGPPAQFDILPIVFWNIDLPDRSGRWGREEKGPRKYLCTGSPVTVTQYKPVRRTKADLTIQNFHLPALK